MSRFSVDGLALNSGILAELAPPPPTPPYLPCQSRRLFVSLMERLILSGEMGSFPVRTANRHAHHEGMKRDIEENEFLALDGDGSSQVSWTNEEVFPSFPCSSRYHEAESDLWSTWTASQRSSSDMGSTPAPTALSTASVVSSFSSDYKSHVRLNADLGSDAGVAHAVANGTDVVAQTPETLSILSADFSERDGVNDEAGAEDGLAAEDWLRVAEVLDEVTEP